MHVFYTPDIQNHTELPDEEVTMLFVYYGCKSVTE